jgi:hypothetical protein
MNDDTDHTRHGSRRATSESARDRRLEYQARWVDLQVQRAIERGEFDNLPGTGKPIEDLGTTHDPDWWLKRFIERERITGVLPPALSLRVEDARLGSVLDAERTERRVRDIVEDFNARVVAARRQLQGGPPVITRTRDVDAEVEAWRQRGAARRERIVRAPTSRQCAAPETRRHARWRRLLP